MPNSFANTTFPRDWAAYYRAVVGRPPRETLLKALDLFDAEPTLTSPRFAVDLGCGDGRDTVEILRRGWQILAVDGNQAALTQLRDRPDIKPEHLENLTTQVMRFESISLPNSVDLINSSFALSFCSPPYFPMLWQEITNSLRVGGRFSGQLLGDRDSWAAYDNMSHYTRDEVEKFLESFNIEELIEEEHPGETALSEQKYWHIFHIVARKK